MKLRIERDVSLSDISVLIRYAEKNPLLHRLIHAVKSCAEKIEALDGDQTVMLNIMDVYYFESVDKKTFACCRENVFRVKDRLYQLKENLAHYGFVQVNKACLLNVNVLTSIRSMLNSKMEATLLNKERISVSRKYISEIKAGVKGW